MCKEKPNQVKLIAIFQPERSIDFLDTFKFYSNYSGIRSTKQTETRLPVCLTDWSPSQTFSVQIASILLFRRQTKLYGEPYNQAQHKILL